MQSFATAEGRFVTRCWIMDGTSTDHLLAGSRLIELDWSFPCPKMFAGSFECIRHMPCRYMSCGVSYLCRSIILAKFSTFSAQVRYLESWARQRLSTVAV